MRHWFFFHFAWKMAPAKSSMPAKNFFINIIGYLTLKVSFTTDMCGLLQKVFGFNLFRDSGKE